MTKEARCVWFLSMVLVAACAGCGHRPAYSDIDTSKSSANQNQNSSAQATTAPPVTVQPGFAPVPVPGAAQPANAPPGAAQSFKRPSFIDPVKGDVKDVPNYPGAHRVNIQFGPVEGSTVASLVLQTNDSMDKISAFYEQAIRNNKWTVTDKLLDPELSEWSLKKGEENSARVQIKKDPQSQRMNIIIVRGEKIPIPPK